MIKKKNRGMTLIELLISLAIIGMMTGIAFPIFSYYQKRSTADSDIRNFVSLFNYARSLQNNPENVSRLDSNKKYNYEIKFTNSSNINRAELYLKTDDPAGPIIVDKIDFAEDIMVNGTVGGDGLTITFGGTLPDENIICSPIDCSTSIAIGLTTRGVGAVVKTATILNTTTSQLLSISNN
ncbi:MAG: type II secretion system protein [Candidatus Berkelbacteria bacterium]